MVDLPQELLVKIVEYVSTCDDEHEPYCFRYMIVEHSPSQSQGWSYASGGSGDSGIGIPSPTYRAHLETFFSALLRLPNLQCLGLFHCSGVPASFIHDALSSFPEVALINIDLHDYNCPVTDDTVPAALMRCKDSPPDIEYLESFAQNQELLGGCEIARLYANSLTTMIIHFTVSHVGYPVALPHLPGIRSLTLRASAEHLRRPFVFYNGLPTRMLNIEQLNVVMDYHGYAVLPNIPPPSP
ncbi:hypothetical protein C8J57DRAFT_1719943 [Mycena rebaudengoi]|nr:hypothetical protein C8J57DRAFT_1719943 [Mycena rebaudengoi]